MIPSTYENNVACSGHKYWSQNHKCELANIKVLVTNILHRKTSHNIAPSFHYMYISLKNFPTKNLESLLREARTMTVHTQLLYRKNWIKVPAAATE